MSGTQELSVFVATRLKIPFSAVILPHYAGPNHHPGRSAFPKTLDIFGTNMYHSCTKERGRVGCKRNRYQSG